MRVKKRIWRGGSRLGGGWVVGGLGPPKGDLGGERESESGNRVGMTCAWLGGSIT
jgi:hypothetical protein